MDEWHTIFFVLFFTIAQGDDTFTVKIMESVPKEPSQVAPADVANAEVGESFSKLETESRTELGSGEFHTLPLNLTIRMLDSSSISVQLDASDKIFDLKQRIKEMKGFHIASQDIFSSNSEQPCTDASTVCACVGAQVSTKGGLREVVSISMLY